MRRNHHAQSQSPRQEHSAGGENTSEQAGKIIPAFNTLGKHSQNSSAFAFIIVGLAGEKGSYSNRIHKLLYEIKVKIITSYAIVRHDQGHGKRDGYQGINQQNPAHLAEEVPSTDECGPTSTSLYSISQTFLPTPHYNTT